MKSFKDYIAEAHPTWHVTFKTGHKPQKVKGRNTAEAIKKAEKRAQKSGEKDPRQLAMYKGIKKVSEETEIDEAIELSEADIAEILRQYALSENVNADQLANLTEEEINEIIGKAIGKTFKYGAKAIVGGARLAKKGARAMSSQGRIDRANARKKAADLRYQRKKDSRSIFSAQGRKNRAADKAKADKINQDARDIEKKTNKGDFS